jgi:hypothetical protein
MELAKPRVDIGLCTNNLDPMLHFWQDDAVSDLITFSVSAAVRSSIGMTP